VLVEGLVKRDLCFEVHWDTSASLPNTVTARRCTIKQYEGNEDWSGREQGDQMWGMDTVMIKPEIRGQCVIK
jgi:hypothetical protein